MFKFNHRIGIQSEVIERMAKASNLFGVQAARDIFELILEEKKCLTNLSSELGDDYAKQTIAKYVGQMELVGVLKANWEHDEDGRWRRYYSPGDAEWARLFKKIIELEKKEQAEQE